MTGISRSPESGLEKVEMPSGWDATLAQGDSGRSKILLSQAEQARAQRQERLRNAGLREGSQPQTARR